MEETCVGGITALTTSACAEGEKNRQADASKGNLAGIPVE